MSDTMNEKMKMADMVLAGTYKRFPLVFTEGRGVTLTDIDGRTYTDFVSGIAVCILGHAHPRIAEAVCRQAETLVHVSNLYYTVPQIELAEWLTQNSFADKVFFCNSGAEANEAAIKISRRYFREKDEKGRFRILSAQKSFHGRTMATLSATGQEKIRQGYDPVLEGFDFVPFNDADALKNRMDETTCAVLLEPVQGEGGVRCPDPDYLKEVRRLCDETGTLLIFDEIQTGMGRTGSLFAHEHFGVAPDIMTLAKGLANGLPIGAMLAKDFVAKAFVPGSHASTFGGTPLVTAAALETARILTEERVIDHCREVGAFFRNRLQELADRHEIVKDVRGMGLILGMKLDMTDAMPVVDRCMERGFLINCVQGNILRFVPPLIIEKEHIDSLVECLDDILARIRVKN